MRRSTGIPMPGRKWRCARAAARPSPTGKFRNPSTGATASRSRPCWPASSRPAAPIRSGCISPISAIPCWATASMARISRPRPAILARKARRRWPPSGAKRCTHTFWRWNPPETGPFWSGFRICPKISLACGIRYGRRNDAGDPKKRCYANRLYQPHGDVTPAILPNAPRFSVCCTCVEYPTRNIAARAALTQRPSAGPAAIGGLNHWRALKMARTATLPILNGESGLSRYLAEIRKFPMLEPQQEYMFAKRWREHDDREAAHHLVTSHLRLVAKIAMGYRGYGLPISEVVSEGNVGLMQAVKRFEPDKGFRLATYAMWWIKASIQEYILRSWSLVKMGTTANQKKLFFNLRKAKSKISALEEGDLRPDQVKLIAKRLGVTEQDVIDMNRRMSGDAALNSPLLEASEGEWQDWLVDDAASQEHTLAEGEETGNRLAALRNALGVLNTRERRIFEARRLADEPITLEALSDEFDISRERVRQIEVRAFEKIQSAVKAEIG